MSIIPRRFVAFIMTLPVRSSPTTGTQNYCFAKIGQKIVLSIVVCLTFLGFITVYTSLKISMHQ